MIKRNVMFAALIIAAAVFALLVISFLNPTSLQADANNFEAPTDTNQPLVTATPTAPIPTPKPTDPPQSPSHQQAQITPAPTSLLPDDCRITYTENTRNYDKENNITQLTISLELQPDFSTRNTYFLYPQNFSLKTDGYTIIFPDVNIVNNHIPLNENIKQTTTLSFAVPGYYNATTYELTYNNPPAIIFYWKQT